MENIPTLTQKLYWSKQVSQFTSRVAMEEALSMGMATTVAATAEVASARMSVRVRDFIFDDGEGCFVSDIRVGGGFVLL